MRDRVRVRERLRILAVILGVALVGLAGWQGYRWLRAPWPARRVTAEGMCYLRGHQQRLDVVDAPFDASLLEPLVEDKRVILLGEAHAVADNAELDLALLQWLHAHAGVRTYIDESGYCSAALIQRYLDTGDETWLERVYAQWEGTRAWTVEGYAFWLGVRAFNETLPKAERVRVVGLDVEHQERTALWYLVGLLPDGTRVPNALRWYVTDLRVAHEAQVDSVAEWVVAIQLGESIEQDAAIWQAYLGEAWLDFELGVRNLGNAVAYYTTEDDTQADKLRDRMIYENFLDVYERCPEGAFYGRWGRFHVRQLPRRGVASLGTLLDSADSPVGGQVLSIALVYDKCGILGPVEDGYERSTVWEPGWVVNPLRRASKGGAWTLFALEGLDDASSPFERGCYLVEDATSGGVTTDYWQAMILVRGAEASTPLHE